MQNGRFRIKYTAISAELKAHDFFAHLQYLKEYFHLQDYLTDALTMSRKIPHF